VPAGKIADQFGRRRVFMVGLSIFAAGSLLSAGAFDVWSLIAGRAAQGIGAATVVPTSLALVSDLFPMQQRHSKIAIWAAAGTVAGALGPAVGGALTVISWRLIFIVNVLIIVVSFIFATLLPKHAPIRSERPDYLGVIALFSGIAAIVTAVSYVTEWGAVSPGFIGLAACSVLALALITWRGLRHPNPVLDVRLFRQRSLTSASSGMLFFYACFTAMLLGGGLLLISGWGWNPVRAGLALSIWPLSATITAIAIARKVQSPRVLAATGSALFCLASVLWIVATALTNVPAFLAGAALSGAAAGLAQPGFLSGGVAQSAERQIATSMGVVNTARQVGSALGTAAFIAIVANSGSTLVFQTAWVCTGTAAAAALVCALLIVRRT